MKALLLVIAIGIMVLPVPSLAEEQLRDSSGVVIEIRQESIGATYAFDGNRNPLYTAIGIPGGQGSVDYRNTSGVHTRIGGPGTYSEAVEPMIKFDTSGQAASR